MIHESYGDDLDMTTDEEDTYHKSSFNSPPDKGSPKLRTQLNDKYDVSVVLIYAKNKCQKIYLFDTILY
jgi:hypothetical protein